MGEDTYCWNWDSKQNHFLVCGTEEDIRAEIIFHSPVFASILYIAGFFVLSIICICCYGFWDENKNS